MNSSHRRVKFAQISEIRGLKKGGKGGGVFVKYPLFSRLTIIPDEELLLHILYDLQKRHQYVTIPPDFVAFFPTLCKYYHGDYYGNYLSKKWQVAYIVLSSQRKASPEIYQDSAGTKETCRGISETD